MSRDVIPDKKAQQIKRLVKKVGDHRATHAGTLKAAFDELGKVTRLLSEASADVEAELQNDIKILLSLIRKFRGRITKTLKVKVSDLAAADQHLEKAATHLQEAEGSGYELQGLDLQASIDNHRIHRLRVSLGVRAREAAFVLAELEQAVDPLPGMKMKSAAERKRNDKARAKAQPTQEGVAPADNIPTT